jgi:hypothetical protein
VTAVLIDTSVWRKYFLGRAPAHAVRILDELLDEEGWVLAERARGLEP